MLIIIWELGTSAPNWRPHEFTELWKCEKEKKETLYI